MCPTLASVYWMNPRVSATSTSTIGWCTQEGPSGPPWMGTVASCRQAHQCAQRDYCDLQAYYPQMKTKHAHTHFTSTHPPSLVSTVV